MIRLGGRKINNVVFDKDGTLLDFHRTWDAAFGATLRTLAPDTTSLEGAARAVGYDLAEQRVEPNSPIVAESNMTIMGLLDAWFDTSEFEDLLAISAASTIRASTGATSLLERLVAASVVVGLVTNDSERVAREQVAQLGWDDHIGVVVGYDSGFGAKPDPGPVRAGLQQMAVDGAAAAMIGDSIHDVVAGRDAGLLTVYVGSLPDVGKQADLVISDLVELASLLG